MIFIQNKWKPFEKKPLLLQGEELDQPLEKSPSDIAELKLS